MKEVLYKELAQKEHWSKKIFREKGISIGDVSRALGLTYTYVSGMLSGNIKITDENVTKEQKLRLIQGATQLLVDVLNKNPATTVVVIDEINTDNWGIGGECVTEIRKRSKT